MCGDYSEAGPETSGTGEETDRRGSCTGCGRLKEMTRICEVNEIEKVTVGGMEGGIIGLMK